MIHPGEMTHNATMANAGRAVTITAALHPPGPPPGRLSDLEPSGPPGTGGPSPMSR